MLTFEHLLDLAHIELQVLHRKYCTFDGTIWINKQFSLLSLRAAVIYLPRLLGMLRDRQGQAVLQAYILTHTTKVQSVPQALFRKIVCSIVTRHVLCTTEELTQLYISSFSSISAIAVLFTGWKVSLLGKIWKFRCFLVFCIRRKPPRPYHLCLSLAEVNSLIQIFVNILQLVSESCSALQRNESRCCFHFYTGDIAPARIMPFTWRTSQRSSPAPDCHHSLPFPLPPSSRASRTAFFCCPTELDLRSLVCCPIPGGGRKNKPQKNKTCSHTNPKDGPFVPAAPSYYYALSCHDFFGGKLPMQSASTVGTAQFYKHKVLWLHWFPS